MFLGPSCSELAGAVARVDWHRCKTKTDRKRERVFDTLMGEHGYPSYFPPSLPGAHVATQL